jgi:Fe-Mn family superoxide dismutase
MRLHELYFGVMGGEYMDNMSEPFSNDLKEHFGSFEAWKKNFMNVGSIPGVGFVVLCRDRLTGRLFNNWISNFQTGELIDVDPLLVMDMWEHSYIAQFGLDVQKYKETFLKNVNWSVVSYRWYESVKGNRFIFK